MRTLRTLAAALALWIPWGSACGKDIVVTVTYRSAENVYVDGGGSAGLGAGSRLGRMNAGGDSVLLEVVYASLHSASCRLVSTGAPPEVEVGQKFTLLSAPVSSASASGSKATDTTGTPAAAAPEAASVQSATYSRARTPARVSGSVSFNLHHWADEATPGLDYTQSTARLNLRVQRVLNENMTLVVRSRGRYEDRASYYRSVAAHQWDNRLWELSLTYDAPDRPLSFSAGRTLVRNLPSAGYVDGGQAEVRFGGAWHMGAFGGRRPDWLYRDDALSMTAFGGYLSVESASGDRVTWQEAVGALAEYHDGEVSRTALLLSGRLHTGGDWGFYHTIEADVNTGWRKDAAGRSLDLSRAFASLYVRISRSMRLTVSYDNLKPYWTYDYRSTVDSLFDDRVRQGWRLQTQWSPGRSLFVGFGGGYRQRSGDADPTLSWFGNMRRSGVVERWLAVGASVSGFDGPFEHGLTYHLQTDYTRPGLPRLRAGYGQYRYSVKSVTGSRASRTAEFGADLDVARSYYAGAWAEHASGDDIKGWRLQLEIGHRL
jgi:hypothetical protein